jgi:hypothetical protein
VAVGITLSIVPSLATIRRISSSSAARSSSGFIGVLTGPSGVVGPIAGMPRMASRALSAASPAPGRVQVLLGGGDAAVAEAFLDDLEVGAAGDTGNQQCCDLVE